MNKQAREAIVLAESEGLKFCGLIERSKHEFLVFENCQGLQYWQPCHRSAKEAKMVHKVNNKNVLRRFARGELQGIERMVRGAINV
ncbi:hypothetical protein UFOVP231_68 [uncultured Caudovirales phage]|uniref:Uncharacterized protein n=1 Tax=uncultured Caudovirales phage TaxID=2100421 RepID=A0A6J7WQY1_9CAUD|nr:hypothetical protein UFOVP231_68 [uncultured Caudovirales phage]